MSQLLGDFCALSKNGAWNAHEILSRVKLRVLLEKRKESVLTEKKEKGKRKREKNKKAEGKKTR